jgi:hypothetical protein
LAYNHKTGQAYPSRKSSGYTPIGDKMDESGPSPSSRKRKPVESEEDDEEKEFQAFKKKREEDLREEWKRSKRGSLEATLKKKGEGEDDHIQQLGDISYLETASVISHRERDDKIQTKTQETTSNRPKISQGLAGLNGNQLRIFTTEEKRIEEWIYLF